MAGSGHARIAVRAFAKINLSLRVLGVRDDGYHDLRTTFQSVALHDTLIFDASPGGFRIECDDPSCPTDSANLVWRAAEGVWLATGRRGKPRDVRVRIIKRVPVQSGLGGGSSDAAAALRGLSALWRINLGPEEQRRLAAALGADVPFFLCGGTVLGVDRGDSLFPLEDIPPAWITLVVPDFGIRTVEAYRWWDHEHGKPRPRLHKATGSLAAFPVHELHNDLEAAVGRHYPEITRIASELRRRGAYYAGMSGSGSAVFGLFDSHDVAERASRALAGRARRSLVTRTVTRTRFRALSRPR